MALTESNMLPLGTEAPGFSLPDTVSGNTITLKDIVTDKGTVVMFLCNHCPYVKAILERLVRDTAELAEHGIASVAIMANDAAQYAEDSPDRMKAIAEQYQFSFPYLLDGSQAVAKRYGAVCTPDFFGYNADLQLQYRGRLDASRKETAAESVKRDLFLAMQQVAQSGTGPSQQFPSMGCSIKWKPEAG
jgi:peroxiredoxin